jgi:hypothetical protein
LMTSMRTMAISDSSGALPCKSSFAFMVELRSPLTALYENANKSA